MEETWIEFKAFFLKILAPALVAISVKLAVQSTKKKVSMFQVIVSFITGIGCAYLFSGVIVETFSDKWQTVYVAIIAISGEKISYWLVYRFNVEEILTTLLDKIKK